VNDLFCVLSKTHANRGIQLRGYLKVDEKKLDTPTST